MRRRIYSTVAAIVAASLTIGVTIALAAKPKTKSVDASCSVNVTTVAPSGSTSVQAAPSQGTQYGPVHCNKLLTHGVQGDSFTVPDSGDMVGSYTQYFGAGTVSGTFTLTPQEGPPLTGGSFQSQTYTGTLTVTGGTGIYRGIKGSGGTLNCSTPDTVHLSCTEKVKLTPK